MFECYTVLELYGGYVHLKRFLALNNNDFPNGIGLERSDVWQRYKISKRAKRSQYTTGDNHVSRFSSAVCVLGGTYH